MLDRNWRIVVGSILNSIGRSLHRAGVTADAVTVTGIVMGAGASVAIGLGYLRLGFALLVLTGIPDVLDGPMVRASGRFLASPRGDFFESVSNRLIDAMLLGGVAWHYTITRPGRLVMLPVAVLVVGLLISYERAKAESLDLDAPGGLMERAERFIALSVGLLFSEVLTAVLWLILALSAITASKHFASAWRQASALEETAYHRRSARRRKLRLERREARYQRTATRRREAKQRLR